MTSTTPVTAGKKWGTLVISCLAMLLLALDMTVLHMATPRLVEDMTPSATQLLWILDAYGFALAGLLITFGNIGDRIGRKKLLLIGTVAFGAASAVTAYAPTPELLIAARALLGVAGATIMPSTLSIIRNVFTDPKERTSAVGIWSSVSALGFAIGPVAGGALLAHFWWGSVFLINVPITIALVIGGALVLPESRNPRPGRLDIVSVPLSIVGVISIVYAIKVAAHDGIADPAVWISAALGLIAFVVFVRRQTKLSEPLIDVRLFKVRAFSGAVGANVAIIFGMLSISVAFAQYFQLVRGWSPLIAGLAGLPGGIGAAIAGGFAGALVMALGRAKMVALGLALTSIGFFLYGLIDVDTSYGFMLIPMAIAGLGMGFTFAVTNDTIIASVPRERAGAASAISETATEVGGALGIAILGSILGGLYTGNLIIPSGVPADAATVAGESLGGAVHVASLLPTSIGAQLLEAAQRTYVDSMHSTLMVGGITMIVLALACLWALRGTPKEIPEVILDDTGHVEQPVH
ncbi:DHA2 family efflux MFS transporter permease subunit [Herbidospora mongoliensis]|uniref:DHA2 family efflux MFS transporter permease subunit n=1 Tax=Herbidospora mongoliensis TaxID=688067 RepID=UPI00082AA9AE|nr:DHA2 family efflux MFS transporter permease subunit [Herbidospora mongoliensis]